VPDDCRYSRLAAAQARRTVEREGTTLKALVEAGLRRVLAERGSKATRFRLRDASFRGEGLQAGVATGSWEAVRDAIYEGRGA
jgi:hypothetical protein